MLVVGLIKFGSFIGEFVNYKCNWGMLIYYDWIDWFGGYLFEVVMFEVVCVKFVESGFEFINLKLIYWFGCNEFVFKCVMDL